MQRHVSAVLYLNDQGSAFGGGDFRFQGEPRAVRPVAGRLVAYTAGQAGSHMSMPPGRRPCNAWCQ